MGAGPNDDSKELWFVRRGDEVRGPYCWSVIARDVGLGRIHAAHRLSRDQVSWLGVEEILPKTPAPETLVGSAHDERRVQRRSVTRDPPVEQRAADERRTAEASGVVERRLRSERVWAGLNLSARPQARAPLLVIVLALSASLALATHLSLPAGAAAPDCHAAAAAKVNWDFCAKPKQQLAQGNLAGMSARNAQLSGADLSNANLRGVDFAYADLSATDFTLADARQARLVGASLRKAVFNHAQLIGADLSFADLSGASLVDVDLSATRLGNTIWTDGRVCAENSVGACNSQ
jgi:uncharacterized protein YjbI with pentapeptide repeats